MQCPSPVSLPITISSMGTPPNSPVVAPVALNYPPPVYEEEAESQSSLEDLQSLDLSHSSRKLEDKEDSGYSPFLVQPQLGHLRTPYPMMSSIFGDSKNWEKADSSTTRSWSPSPRKLDFHVSSNSSETPSMPSSPSQRKHVTTFGKKTHVSPELNLNLEDWQFDGIKTLTGMPLKKQLSLAIFRAFRPIYTFVVTTSSGKP